MVDLLQEQRVDRDLSDLAGVGAGDQHALAALYARHGAALFAFILRFTSDRGLAEEILQDAFVVVWQTSRGFEGRSTFRSWLFGIAYRKVHDALRRRAHELADASELERIHVPGPDLSDLVIGATDCELIVAAINRLSPIHRDILLLWGVWSFSYAELAETLRVPLGTIKSRLSAARRALGRELDRGGIGAG